MAEPLHNRREIAIRVPVLARVEGEGALEVTARGGTVEELRLRIYEPASVRWRIR